MALNDDHSVSVDWVGRVARVRLDRPETRNALSDATLVALAEAFEDAQRADARCVLLAGSERVFASGADLKELRDRTAVDHYLGHRHASWDRIRNIAIPVVAVVRGHCLGGGFELALSADLVVASEEATFRFPETGLGLIPGGGGSQLLRRAVGRPLAMDLVLTGRTLTAQEALDAGIVARVAPNAAVESEALAVANSICEKGPIATRLAKETINRAFDLGWNAGLEHERRAFAITLSGDEAAEGIAAFVEKRPPRWDS